MVSSKALSSTASLLLSIVPSHKSVEAHLRTFLTMSVKYFDLFVY